MLIRNSTYAPWILLVGDVIALMLFVLVGQGNHNTVDAGNAVLGVAKTAAPFIIAFGIVGWILDAYRFDARERSWAFLARSLNAWLVAIPFALVARAFLINETAIPTMFVITATGFGGLFVLAMRGLFILLRRAAR
jgi:hypothetical protein